MKNEQTVIRNHPTPFGLTSYMLLAVFVLGVLVVTPLLVAQQPATKQTPASPQRTYPKEIRGYKLERAKVEIKRKKSSEGSEASKPDAADSDALIQFGEPTIARMTPLGFTLEVPVTIAAVKQKGKVDFLMFEDMVVNEVPVTVEDYNLPFELPTNKPVLLPKPVRIFISMPRALLGALGEWNESKDSWPVTGRVYVFGQFKKFLFKFKRVVPVELSVSLPNPLLKKKDESGKATDGK